MDFTYMKKRLKIKALTSCKDNTPQYIERGQNEDSHI